MPARLANAHLIKALTMTLNPNTNPNPNTNSSPNHNPIPNPNPTANLSDSTIFKTLNDP